MYDKFIESISKDIGLPPTVVYKVYKSYWKYIRDTIEELPLADVKSEEEFLKLRTNFNIPSLGKLTCTYDRFKRVRKRYELIRDLKNKI